MSSLIRSLTPAWASHLACRHPVGQRLLIDLFLAAVLAAAAVAIPLGSDEELLGAVSTPGSPGGWLLLIGAAWAVPFRRIAPLSALTAGAVLQLTSWTIGYPDTFVSAAVLLYSAAAHGSAQRRRLPWAVAAVLTAYTALGVVAVDVPLYALPLVGLFSVTAVAFGSNIAAGQAYTRATEARAIDLERSRQADRDRALAEERARIARELHDVVAHGLSVIVVQAAAARRILDRDPAGAATALGQIEDTGRNALGEMRHVLSAIRTEPEESWRPARGLDDLDTLVNELGRAGLPVAVEHGVHVDEDETDRGDGGKLPGSVPATVDVTAYRIVRESLTNVLKHGGPEATAHVGVIHRPGNLELTITDTGRGALAEEGGGHGLRGIQERVEVFGGRFSAGPRLGGGFTVEVSLPLRERHENATDPGTSTSTSTGESADDPGSMPGSEPGTRPGAERG